MGRLLVRPSLRSEAARLVILRLPGQALGRTLRAVCHGGGQAQTRLGRHRALAPPPLRYGRRYHLMLPDGTSVGFGGPCAHVRASLPRLLDRLPPSSSSTYQEGARQTQRRGPPGRLSRSQKKQPTPRRTLGDKFKEIFSEEPARAQLGRQHQEQRGGRAVRASQRAEGKAATEAGGSVELLLFFFFAGPPRRDAARKRIAAYKALLQGQVRRVVGHLKA